MATNQSVGTGLRYRARYTLGIPLVAASVAAIFVIGAVLGTDDRPTLRSSVAESGVTASVGTSREAMITQAMADGATWRELTGESAGAASASIPDFAATDGIFPIPSATVPDMEATDGVFPIPMEASSVSPVSTGDDAVDNAIIEMDEVNAVQPLMPLTDVVSPGAPGYDASFERALFEAEVERMLHGEATAAETATASSVTDDLEYGGLPDELRLWLEYELTAYP